MCKITTPTKPTRFVRVLCSRPAELLSIGARVPISITVIRKGRPFVQCYWLEQFDGGYRLWLERDDQEPEHHDIDATFGPVPEEHWSCTCGDYTWRYRQRGACKHILGVAALLRKLGLLEVAE